MVAKSGGEPGLIGVPMLEWNAVIEINLPFFRKWIVKMGGVRRSGMES
ncbi:MAG: hypothetical protein OEZ10_05370 [Gammaproteobacteria bacterium]|nr:hypothetical protein [Gammaproteobacteria bacterium]